MEDDKKTSGVVPFSVLVLTYLLHLPWRLFEDLALDWVNRQLGEQVEDVALVPILVEWGPPLLAATVVLSVFYWFALRRARAELASSPTGGSPLEEAFVPKKMAMLELAENAIGRGWAILDASKLESLDFLDAFRQAALDGEVKAWGRPKRFFDSTTRHELLEEISQRHWKACRISVHSLMRQVKSQPVALNTDNFGVCTHSDERGSAEYHDIHLDRESALRYLETEAEAYRGKRDRHEKE
jgi:hypothetical protein